MLKKIGYGLILWVIPYVTAIPLMGLMQTDLIFFKTIMIVEGTLVGGVLSALYFQGVTSQFLWEGLITSAVWIVMNWTLDFVALLPFSGHSIPRYFIEIGARYVAMGVPLVAIGYVLEHRSQQNRERTA
ncbi:MAG: hypothetical protein AAB308_07980 [Nitrospirota bacterium]